MIYSFQEKNLAILFNTSKRPPGIPAELERALIKKLKILNEANSEIDLHNNGARYERLDMVKNEMSSIRVNSKYRLIFAWSNGVHNLRLVPHNYKVLLH